MLALLRHLMASCVRLCRRSYFQPTKQQRPYFLKLDADPHLGRERERERERRGSAGAASRAHEFKQVESCFLNHNQSIHCCCTDSSLFMIHRGELSLSIIIRRIGGGGQVSFCPGAQKFS